MNLSQLLATRSALLRQADLANSAFAYHVLSTLARRIENARLRGPARLLAIDPSVERFAPQFIALAGSQSVLEEHFDETDLVRLADALAYLSTEVEAPTEFEFRLEAFFAQFVAPLRERLQAAGVNVSDTEERVAPESRT